AVLSQMRFSAPAEIYSGIHSPDELAPLGPAGPAVVAGQPLGSPVAAALDTAARTLGAPLALGHVGILAVAPLRPGANLPALGLPHLIVPVLVPDQGVGNLVQDDVSHVLLAVSLDVVDRQADTTRPKPEGVGAEPGTPARPVEGELPAGQAVLRHQGQ